MKMRWRPLLKKVKQEQALDSARAIADALENIDWGLHQDPSLAGGAAGLAVMFAYLAEAQPSRGYQEAARRCLEQAIDAVGASFTSHSLYSGFPGVAWAVEHVRGHSSGRQKDDPNKDAESALREFVSQKPWRNEYDLVNGIVGLGVFALERMPRRAAVQTLKHVVERLSETAERDAGGVTWRTLPAWFIGKARQEYPLGYYNLGMAHGVPAVIALLAGVRAANVAAAKTEPLLEMSVEWLLQQKLPPEAPNRFPFAVGPGIQPVPAGPAWCYGEVGVAMALLLAARASKKVGWEREARALARHAARRTSDESGVAVDVGLCHGAAGVGHIYNRLYQMTGETLFEQAARAWFDRLLEMRATAGPLAGLRSTDSVREGELPFAKGTGLLVGAAGVSLALLAAATAIEPQWDRMLLLSLRP